MNPINNKFRFNGNLSNPSGLIEKNEIFAIVIAAFRLSLSAKLHCPGNETRQSASELNRRNYA